MSNICEICKWDTIFYIWSSSRHFNRQKLLKLVSKKDKLMRNRIMKESYPVCMICCEKLGLMER